MRRVRVASLAYAVLFSSSVVPATGRVNAIDVHGPQRWCSGNFTIPSFMIVGFQKCGSTTLVGDLSRLVQPLCRAREQHFFSLVKNAPFSLPTYGERIGTPCPRQPPRDAATMPRAYCFEKTPDYAVRLGTASRIAASYGQLARDLKFIAIVRNPTNRVMAWFTHFAVSLGKFPTYANASVSFTAHAGLECVATCATANKLTLASPVLGFTCTRAFFARAGVMAACKHTPGMILSGLYGAFIDRFLHVFEPSSFLAISLGGYLREPSLVRKDILRHIFVADAALSAEALTLGAQSLNRKASTVAPHRGRGRYELEPAVRQGLDHFYAPHNEHSLRVLSSRGVRCSPGQPTMESFFGRHV